VADQIQLFQDLVNFGRYLEARELGLKLRTNSNLDLERVDQLLALSLSKSGSPEDALAVLDLTYRRNPNDPETAGILGGIYKELFKKHQDSKYAILSRDTYAKNFEVTKNYYTGINAATMSAIAGRAMQGREIANSVISLIGEKQEGIWELATLGEAYLLTKNRERCVEYYIKARKLAGNDWGKVLSIHNQLWLLNHYIPVPKEVMRIFAPPEVVAFAGHMIDAPGRATPRFPAMIESKVKEAIRGAIRTLHASIGYCSLASGGDILFAEAMIEEGGELHILMPFEKEEFIQTSLKFAGDEWVNRFEKIYSSHPVILLTKDTYGGNDDLFSLVGKFIFGSAILRSQMYHQEPNLLTVLSEFDLKQKAGGTRDTIQMWPFPLKHININPDSMYRADEVVPTTPTGFKPQVSTIPNRPVLYMAYVDMVNLNPVEKEKVEKVVNAAAEEQQQPFNLVKFTEESLVIAIESDVTLMDMLRSIWNSTAPFKSERPFKIALHAGPVYLSSTDTDPSISLLKAICQFTPKATICTSLNFASVLSLHPKKFQLDYIGVIKLPEETESSGLYQVQLK
jgi:tetratricopeptide (TPR) repeat protein